MASSYPTELTDQFKFMEKIGEGGFAKVRVGKHKLSGEKVAIKIMDKAALMKTNDLPRVALEIQALRDCHHQNIARLFLAHETPTHYYLILEHAPGGELFDYIVARQRCKEDEARRFFRQIAGAVAYCHEQGIAHRDLKPENLLLDKQMNIKLIDFGLIARPDSLGDDLLTTCCGSAAYAAPELIRGEKYHGEAADMWSLGILLYALLVGWLPFDDDNMQTLYRLIQKGVYEIPTFLSPESVKLIGALLKHKPEHRIKMSALLSHSWLLKGTNLAHISPATSLGDKDALDRVVVQELAKFYSTDVPTMEAWICKWEYNDLTATYSLLAQKRRQGGSIRLPAGKHNVPPDVAIALLHSRPADAGPKKSGERMSSHDVASKLLNRNKQSPQPAPDRSGSDNADTLPPINAPLSPEQRSASVGASPNGGGDLSTLHLSDTKEKSNLDPKKKAAIEMRSEQALNMIGQDGDDGRKRGSSFRVFLGSVKNMFGSRDSLTPRKIKGLFTSETTSSKEPEVVLQEVEQVLKSEGYETRVTKFVVQARKTQESGKALKFNMEVCIVSNLQCTGIRGKRVNGDTWDYKKEQKKVLDKLGYGGR